MDDFFSKKTCDRCHGPLTTRIMSMFNTDVLCEDCKKKELVHPDYKKALEADHIQIRNGNYNFSGIGYPAK